MSHRKRILWKLALGAILLLALIHGGGETATSLEAAQLDESPLVDGGPASVFAQLIAENCQDPMANDGRARLVNPFRTDPERSSLANDTEVPTPAGGLEAPYGVDGQLDLQAVEAYTSMVTLTLEVAVPAFTPGTVYIYGNQPELGDWDPGAVPMTHSGAVTWTITLHFPENTELAFSFGRGTAGAEEAAADGNTPVPARELTVAYGSDGNQEASYSVANWRDPIVVDHYPADGATGVPLDTGISVSWSQAMGVGTDFLVEGPGGPISGSFTYYANTYTYVFTPDEYLELGRTYTVTVEGQTDAGGDQQVVPFQFNFDTLVPTSVDLISFGEKPGLNASWWWVSWPWLMILISALSLVGAVLIKRRQRKSAELQKQPIPGSRS